MSLTREQGIELRMVIEERRAALLAEAHEEADLSRDLDELRQIEAARLRLEEGSYGVCADCGNQIDYRRLRASPSAIRCIDCQRLYEKAHQGATGPSL